MFFSVGVFVGFFDSVDVALSVCVWVNLFLSLCVSLSVCVCECRDVSLNFPFPLFLIISLSCYVRVLARPSWRSPSISEEPVYPRGARLSRRSPSIFPEEPVYPGGARLAWRSPSECGKKILRHSQYHKIHVRPVQICLNVFQLWWGSSNSLITAPFWRSPGQ